MKCDTCEHYSAQPREYCGFVEGVYCDGCYIEYLLCIRQQLEHEVSLTKVNSEMMREGDERR